MSIYIFAFSFNVFPMIKISMNFFSLDEEFFIYNL